MKLNADILYEHLSQYVQLRLYARRGRPLNLRRPEFYTGGGREFLSGHVYLTFSDKLPDNPIIGSDSVIISVGGIPQAQYLDSKSTCMVVEENTDMFSLSNLVNSVYDLFDEWEQKLHEILSTTADIKAMVDASEAVFDCPLIVLDKNFKFLAVSKSMPEGSDATLWTPDAKDNVSLEGFSVAMENTQIDMSSREPYMMNVIHPSLCANLFGKEQYIGSLTLSYMGRKERNSDVILLKTLARMMEDAILKLPSMKEEDRQNVLREALSDLLQGLPCNQNQLQKLNEYDNDPSYICIKFVLPNKLKKAPQEYICGLIESSLSNSIVLHYESSILAFANVNEHPNGAEKLHRELQRFLASTHMKAGISYRFSTLTSARTYYRQACIAVEHMEVLNPELNMYSFEDCALSYLIIHSTGEFPLDNLLPDGLKRLIEMDSNSKTDYIQTLRAYLDNNMNISKSAQALYLHRSSFLDRLQRIQNVLNLNMHDPDVRLEIEILLKAMKMHEQIQQSRKK